jgi:hypothetical protein
MAKTVVEKILHKNETLRKLDKQQNHSMSQEGARFMLDQETLRQMRSIDINTIDPDTVVDASEIYIDTKMPVPERMAEYVRQIRNPYFMKVGKVIVKMNFADTSVTAKECYERYLKLC